METLVNILTPVNFIGLCCVRHGIINNLKIRRISFKDRTQYDSTICETVRALPDMKFKFGTLGVWLYGDKLLLDTVSATRFGNGKDTGNFLLKCTIYVSGPNVGNHTMFHNENMLFKTNEVVLANEFEQTFQNKFISMLQAINTQYGTTYVFSFKFERIFVVNNEKTVNFSIGQNNQLTFVTSEKSTENVASASLVTSSISSNKKRKIEFEDEEESGGEE